MKLIDADSFLRVIINRCGCVPYIEGRNGETIYLNSLINEQPISYDIDSVLEKLEQHKKEIKGRKERDILNKVANTNSKATVEKDIEIVKSGYICG